MTKIVLPKKPEDGHRVTFWRINSHSDGLIQVRWTYIANKSCEEVCGEFYKDRGVPYVNDWYIESRYMSPASVSAWTGQGRHSHEDAAAAQFENCYSTFEEARHAAFEHISTSAGFHRREADRLGVLLGAFFAMEEPA